MMKLHTPKEEQIFELLSPTAQEIGFEIVKVRIHGGNRPTLEILIDHNDLDKKVTIADCRNASNNFSAILDVEDLISSKYYLEVSSAGVERPLTKLEDFIKFKAREISLKLHNAVEDRKKIEGIIIDVDGDKIHILEKIHSNKNNGKNIIIDFENVKSAKLVFTDAMFREALKAEKNN